jgi:large subunit ribosomal protein L25
MDQINLSAVERSTTGKGPAGRLRRSGMVPAVLYGPGIDGAISLSLNNKELEKVLHTGAGSNALVTLKLEGSENDRMVMFKEVTRNPFRETINHVDLIEVILGTKITVDVPLSITGKAEGVALGGILQQETRTVSIECLPSKIPSSIDVDVTNLAIGDSLHAKDLVLAEGHTVLDDPEMTIVIVGAPVAEEEVKTAEEVEEELSKSFEEAEEGTPEEE